MPRKKKHQFSLAHCHLCNRRDVQQYSAGEFRLTWPVRTKHSVRDEEFNVCDDCMQNLFRRSMPSEGARLYWMWMRNSVLKPFIP